MCPVTPASYLTRLLAESSSKSGLLEGMVTVSVHFLVTITEYPRQANFIKKEVYLVASFVFVVLRLNLEPGTC